MEDQGKRLLLAVVLAFAIMMGWSYLFPPQQPPPQVDESSETQEQTPATPELPKPTLQGEAGSGGQAGVELGGAPAVERGEEQLYELEFDTFRAVFTSYGGALKSWTLLGDKYRVEENGETRQINLVRTGDEALLPFRIGFDDLDLIPAKTEWQGRRKSDTEIEFTWSYVVEEDGSPVTLFDIVKTYRLYPDEYLVELTVDVENQNAGEQSLAMIVSLFGYQDPTADTGGSWFMPVDAAWKSACYVNDELEVAGLEDLSETPRQRTGRVRWAGLTHGYFLAAAAPEIDTDAQLACRVSLVPGEPGAMRADIVFPEFRVRAGDPRMTRSVIAYLGPKYLDDLESVHATIGRDPGFSEAIDLGWFGFLARPLLWLLQLFHSLVGNWGLAIVMLTVVVKLATLYWTTKSMRSMKKMARLKPKIEALQKKYKDDRQRQQAEMMNLYKAHGVNPLAGCLPMLLQMPIWFALYRMLMAAAELYRAPFIPGWINDLTAADPLYILPIILVGMMFLQAKLSPTTADSTQQKIMMYGLPLSFGVFSFFLPSGLTLYILTNTVLTTLHQLWMNRTDPMPPAKSETAKADTTGGKSKSADRGEGDGAAERGEARESKADDDTRAGQRASGGKSGKQRGGSGSKGRRGKSRRR